MWLQTVPRAIRGKHAWPLLLVSLLAGVPAAGCRKDLSGLRGVLEPDAPDSGVGADSAGSSVESAPSGPRWWPGARAGRDRGAARRTGAGDTRRASSRRSTEKQSGRGLGFA